ncbi:DUF805 domain-containing protein [Hymenobacter negativus]|uniref:DUF805 domain-containing protein n=1 Tax=Hymenobacter negativus TaxID=2795026 RepID=A0ABS3QIF8_9BACT|nr:DUF805 domain-containing protein [Hymenobacter negativus]MBO2011023.1 DUF805 domain-containing protein [Hymenobacter negativus]
MNYFLDVLKNKYAMFSGRARRAEFWQFYLFMVIGIVVFGGIGSVIRFPALVGIFYFAMIVPFIALSVRRMHDVGKDWWYIFIPIYNLILYCTEGTRGPNEYGPDPKGAVTADTLNTPPSTY